MSDRLLKRKSYVYVLRGARLLVFSEPDVSRDVLHIPGGTIDPGETELDAAYREVFEETGRDDLKIDHFIGHNIIDYDEAMVPERHKQFFFVGQFQGECPENWTYYENTPNEGGPPVRLAYGWIDLLSTWSGLHEKYTGYLSDIVTFAQLHADRAR